MKFRVVSLLLTVSLLLNALTNAKRASAAGSDNRSAQISAIDQVMNTPLLGASTGTKYVMTWVRATDTGSQSVPAKENGTTLHYDSWNTLCTCSSMANLLNRRLAMDNFKMYLSIDDTVYVTTPNADNPHFGHEYLHGDGKNVVRVCQTAGQFNGGATDYADTRDGKRTETFAVSFSDGSSCNMTVKVYQFSKSCALSERKAIIKQYLDNHPEGIYAYYVDSSQDTPDWSGNATAVNGKHKQNHAFLITDYTDLGNNDYSFCAIDSAWANPGWSNSRQPLEKTYTAFAKEPTSEVIAAHKANSSNVESWFTGNADKVIQKIDHLYYIESAANIPPAPTPVTASNLELRKVSNDVVAPRNILDAFELDSNTSYHICGTISGDRITKIVANVSDEHGAVKLSATADWGSPAYRQFNLRGSAIDNGIAFGKLSPGYYYLSFNVYTKDNQGNTRYSCFTVKIKILNTTQATNNGKVSVSFAGFKSTLPYNQSYGIPGTISSPTTILKIEAKVVDGASGGQWGYVTSKYRENFTKNNVDYSGQKIEYTWANPGTKTVYISGSPIDNNIFFAGLKRGNYYFQLTVYPAGSDPQVFRKAFTIK